MSAQNVWIRHSRLRPRAKLKLFCFPFAGGGASVFHEWSRHLPETIDVCPVQLPGREDRFRERPFQSIEPLVDELSTAIRPALDRPFAFFGHSMGALIAFELARRGLAPARLFISAHRAPQSPRTRTAVHELPGAAFTAELRRMEGTPEAILNNSELMDLLMPVLRADFGLCEKYVMTIGEPLNCPFSLYRGIADSEVRARDMEPWAAHTTGPCTLEALPGGHFFLHSSRRLLLARIAELLG